MNHLVLTALLASAVAAPAAEQRLFEHEPYDRLKLNDKQGTVLRLVLVDLPGRSVPRNPDPKSLLRVRLFERPDRPYEVAWGDVAELRLWEQLLLDEAQRLVAERRFVEAFDFFVYLRREHPKLPGLDEAETAALVAEIEHDLSGDRPQAAMARVLRLQQRNTLHPQLAELMTSAAELLVADDLKHDRPRAARLTVERLARQFPKHPRTTTLQAALADESAKQLASANRALDERRYSSAADAAQTAAVLANDAGPALDVYRRAVEAYPVLRVGVVETVRSSSGPHPVPSWAQRRVAPLERRPTLEPTFSGGNPPRADYVGDANRWEADDRDPLRFRLHLGGGPFDPSAADAAARLAAAARPDVPTSRPDLVALAPRSSVVDPRTLILDFARPHPRPEALIADVLAAPPVGIVFAQRRPAPYPVASVADDVVVRTRSTAATGGPAEIVERRFADEVQAAAALSAGEVDVVDRIAPWQTTELGRKRELRLVRYAAPSVHLLVFNGAQPRWQRSELRRAVAYALDRESILRNHLQPERTDPSARLTDGVFPIGRTNDDPLGYAYDATGPSRPYDPMRAFLLAQLVESDAPTASPLVLTHPATATAAKACIRIAAYLRQVGLAVELRPAASDDAPTAADAADLAYVVVSSCEPLVEVQLWFGPGGLVNLDSRALDSALAQAARAESFATARAALFEVQRVLHDEALVVPLWQLPEHVVWRSRVVPPADLLPTSLYQQIDQLQILPQYNEALP